MISLKFQNLLLDSAGPMGQPLRLGTSSHPQTFVLHHEDSVVLNASSAQQLPDISFSLLLQAGASTVQAELVVRWQLLDGKHTFSLHPSAASQWTQVQPGVFLHNAGAGTLTLQESSDGILIVGTLDMDYASQQKAA